MIHIFIVSLALVLQVVAAPRQPGPPHSPSVKPGCACRAGFRPGNVTMPTRQFSAAWLPSGPRYPPGRPAPLRLAGIARAWATRTAGMMNVRTAEPQTPPVGPPRHAGAKLRLAALIATQPSKR